MDCCCFQGTGCVPITCCKGGTSLYCTVMSDTIGVGWRAFSGTVDPWTKNQLVCSATKDLIKAGMDPACAVKQANSDATKTLETFKGKGALGVCFTGADPSQFWCGVKAGIADPFANLTTTIIWIMVLAIVAMLVFDFSIREAI